jgi:intraflagellar transport protein 46
VCAPRTRARVRSRSRSVTQQQAAFAQLEQENEDRRMAEQMAQPMAQPSPTANQGMVAPQGLQNDDFRPDTAAALQAVQAMESEGAGIDGFAPPDGGDAGLGDSQLVSNQPYDEAMALTSEDESMMSSGFDGNSMHAPGAAEQQAAEPQPDEAHGFGSSNEFGSESPSPDAGGGRSLAMDEPARASSPQGQPEDSLAGFAQDQTADSSAGPGSPPAADEHDDDDDATSSSSDDENSGMGPGMGGGGNDDADYETLQVGPDVRELFEHIGRYQPHSIELEAVLKPFIPDFIPGIGDADAFIKVPRPDGAEQTLGLTILDEPMAVQSDPGVLELQLRAASKMNNVKDATVRSVESADKNPAALTKWMESVAEIQRTRPQPAVTYTHEVPTMDMLMQAWPPQMEAALGEITLPTATLDLELVDFCKALCAILDIPVHDNKLVESTHVLFTLFSEFKANQHFAAYGGEPACCLWRCSCCMRYALTSAACVQPVCSSLCAASLVAHQIHAPCVFCAVIVIVIVIGLIYR